MTRDELRLEYLNGFARLLASWLVSADQKKGVRALQLVLARDDGVMDQLLAVYQSQREDGDDVAEKMQATQLAGVGIPQDVIDQAKQVGMDAEVLVKLCVAHSVQAARDFLSWFSSKLPAGK